MLISAVGVGERARSRAAPCSRVRLPMKFHSQTTPAFLRHCNAFTLFFAIRNFYERRICALKSFLFNQSRRQTSVPYLILFVGSFCAKQPDAYYTSAEYCLLFFMDGST